MSYCPTCGAVRGAHRQEEYCDSCLQEGCTKCMHDSLCEFCREAEAAQDAVKFESL